MNAIFFGAKRAFHSTLRITRRHLAQLGLTAARFDMLTVVWRHPCGILQSGLRGQLGVTAQTISRMLRSLEELGLIRRHRSITDGRRFFVRLTDKGRSIVRRATRHFIHSGAIQLAVDCALVNAPHLGNEWACMTAMTSAERLLKRLRAAFFDRATLYYPWHPDD